MPEVDILIIGAGFAGLALAAALGDVSTTVRVGIVSPTWPAPWPNQFGLWLDEIEHDPELVACCAHRFERPVVYLGERTISLERTYMRLDNEAVRDLFVRRAERATLQRWTGTVAQIRHETAGSVVGVEQDGAHVHVRAALVVDATGHAPRFVRRSRPDSPGYQVAYGVHGHVVRAPKGWLDVMRVMDFRPAGAHAGRERTHPSFLYAMPLGEGDVFLEETSLVERPGMSIEELKERLEARLALEGVELEARHDEEFCRIPMGHALPDFSQRTLAWGGAASGVHPASGYQIARTFLRSPALAAALVGLVGDSALQGVERARCAWTHIWPARDVKRRELYMYGMELMIDMSLEDMERFFTAFFDLPGPLWKGYMSDTLEHGEVLTSMWQMFAAIKGRRRFDLMRPAWQSGAMRARLIQGVLGGAIEVWR